MTLAPRLARVLVRALSVLLACAGAVAAPEEEAYGRSAGYPVGQLHDWFWQRHLVGTQSRMEALFQVREVRAGSAASKLPVPVPAAAMDWPELRSYLDTHPATGLLILRDGRIAAEHYQYGRKPEDRFTSWSMAKTVVSMAVGIAVAEGRIASIEDPVERYEPALAGSAWAGVTIRQALNMASGVRFDETYDRADTDIARLSRAWTVRDGTLLDRLATFTQREAQPGTRFKYVSADTQVLGQVLARATGQTLSDYVSSRIWVPMGAEADAAWVVDGAGMEAAYCCLSARLRDWGRLGQLLLDEGRVGGRQIIPADWVRQATTVRDGDDHLRPRRATPFFGYGFQTWIFPDGYGFALLGVRGQAVFVHPGARLVMVQTAVWPTATPSPALSRQRSLFWRALVDRTLAGR